MASNRLITAHLIITLLLLLACQSIKPTLPIQVNPNTESSPSNFIFSFQLESALPSTGYLMVTFSTFTTSAIPISCDVLDNLTLSVARCVNLNSGGNSITITQSRVNDVNPNINAAKTVVLSFSNTLSPGMQYRIQIRTTNVLPNIGSITKSFELYTITGTGVMIQQNWNFGQAYLQPKQNIDLSVLSRNSMVSNLPGQSFTNLLFQITIGVATPTPNARLKFVIDGGFTFSDSSLVNTQGLVGAAPVILSSVLVSPNVIITTFNQSFTVGRKFTLTIADYRNPLSISSGYISVYHLPFNSMSPLQISQQNIPIQTIPFAPSLQLTTIEGTTPLKPIQYYTSTIQYITLKIIVPRDIDVGFVIKIQADTLIIHQGSVYARTSTVNSAQLGYQYLYSTTCYGVKITGFPLIPQSSTVTVTMRVTIPINPIFTFTVSIDKDANLATPIIYSTVTSNSAAIPDSFITLLTGTQGEPNKISWMKTGDSLISFTVTPSFATNAGSSLKLITSRNLIATSNFVSASSCLVAGIAQPCSVTTNDTFTTILIASNSSYNLFPQSSPITVVINNLSFRYASSHTNFIYHFYFSLTVSQAVSASQRCQLLVPAIISERNILTGFSNYFSNNMNNTGTNFPNVVRLVNTLPAQWTNVIQAWERRIISVFAYQGWTNLFILNNGDAYPATSNFGGLTYTYWKGTTSSNTLEFPLGWDRIDIIMDGTEATTAFSIVLPTTFISSSIDVHYQIMTGVYNTITRQIQYLNIEQRPISPNPTYLQPATASLTAKPKMLTNKIQLAGYSGSYKNNINVTITPGTGTTYSAATYSAALMVVSDWNWYDSTSSLAALSLSSANPVFANVQQTPKSLYMPRNQKYLTYIPLKTTSSITAQFLLYLNSIKLPYSDDLPYYSIYLVDDTGTINCYNQFINQDKSVFYLSYLLDLTFSCNDVSLGVTNTYCTVGFRTNQDIEIGATMTLYLTGMQVATNSCSMQQLPSTTIPITCSSNTDKNQVSVVLSNTARLPAGASYSIRVTGISILSNTIIHNIVVEMRDPTSSYVVEKGTRILITSVQKVNPVYINEVKYSKNNPIVYSSFSIKFQLPRQLNDDQVFALVMSKDLSNLNTIQSKLNVVLYDATDTFIPITWTLNLRSYQILFEGLLSTLAASSYRLQIYGLRTPSTIEQDLISIIYLRKFDSSYTISNNAQSTTAFPGLSDKINSLITMTPWFNTQGLQQQLTFTVNNTFGPVNQQTQWIINLPRYYSQHLWNQDYLIYCTISDVPINCASDSLTPYQIRVWGSPRIVQVGAIYTLKVFGLQCPRAAYLNGNALYVTQSIFLGISANSSSSSYLEYSELFLTDTVIDPEADANYGTITVLGVESSNMQVLQSTFMTINLTCTQPIAQNQWLYLTFPKQFDNFHDLPLVVQVVQGSTDRTYNSQVVNRRIGFQLTSNSLLANTLFSVKISSLPTPTVNGDVDMNKLRIMAVTSNRLLTTAASLQLHNLVQSLTFIPSTLHIVINNYLTIPVTAGTFSAPILIKPSNFGTFVSNMKISFVSDALGFSGSPAYMYLGEASGSFSVGADQSLIPTIYPIDIIKTEASISAFYASLTKYTVLVSNLPITITLPSSFTVPLGGCSVPYQVVLPNAPYTDAKISFEYDTRLYNLHLFWVNQQISYNQLQFNRTITKRWLSFCADPTLGVSTVAVRTFLGGTNYQAYQLSDSVINVNVVANTSTIVNPTFTLVTKNLQKTFAGFQVAPNINGQIYFELMIANSAAFLDLISLKASVKEYDLLLASQKNYLSYTYQSERYHRIGLRKVTVGANPLQFDDLLPGQYYTLCVYFENQHRVTAGQKCTSFSTMAWGSITKAIITFNSTIYESQLNKVLCYFVKASDSKINQVVDLEGRSCSLSSAPENYNYRFNGTTITSQLSQTVIYFVTNSNLTTDPSVAKFASNYDANGITAASLSLALSSFAINYIQSSYARGSFNPPDILGGSSTFTPKFTADKPIYDAGSGTIIISNAYLDKPGSVYMILTFSRKITYNDITGKTDIDIRPALTPSGSNLLNCLDGYNDSPLKCYQIFYVGSTSKTLTFTNISSNSLYVIYYAVANEYPLRPVIVSSVDNYTVLTTFEKLVRILLMATFVLIILSW